MELTKFCQCGAQAELKQFSTFSYFYCNQCKDEVSETKSQLKSNVSGPKFVADMTFEEWQATLEDLYSGSCDFVITLPEYSPTQLLVRHVGCCSFFTDKLLAFKNKNIACVICEERVKV